MSYPTVQPPTSDRVGVYIVGGAVCAVLTLSAVQAFARGYGSGLLPLALAGVIAYGAYRMSSIRVGLAADALIVRNRAQTERLARSEIEGFRLVAIDPPRATNRVFADLHNGDSVRLEGASSKDAALARQHTRQLERWLAAAAR